MEDFNKISIQEMSKNNMYTIIKALEYAGKHSQEEEYIELRKQIVEQLCTLAGCEERAFLHFLRS